MRFIHLVMIKSMTLTNIRNFEHKDVIFQKDMTYMYGPNGSGKTTILEAIHLIATTKSHRTSEEKEVIKEGAPFGKITLVDDQHTYEMVITNQGKRVWLDHVEKKKLSNFIGYLYVVMFAPEDIDLVKGNPQFKRQFLDVAMVQIDKAYLDTLSMYKKILKQRNALLKKLKIGDDLTFLEVINEQLMESGKKIIKTRSQFMETLNEIFTQTCQKFELNYAEIIYKPNTTENKFKDTLNQNIHQDLITKTTNHGPHRDDFLFLFHNKNAKQNASQGQARLLALALKIALYQTLKEDPSKKVTLLLDDVLSELDIENQERVLSLKKEAQQMILNSAIEHKHHKKNTAFKGDLS
jgi:DNA replication and repair protein RecF